MISPHLFVAASAAPLVAQIVTVILAFFITMAILVKVAWGPILNLIDERRNAIKSEFDSLEKRQADLESKVKDYEERLRQIDAEARERINKAIDEGKRMAADIVEEAQRSAEATKEKAKAEIQVEVEKARVQLRDEAVALTIGATQRLLRAELNDDKHKNLVASFISDLQQKKAS